MKKIIKKDKTTTKILLIGANGFLGGRILQFSEKNDYYFQNYDLIASDLENDNIKEAIPFYFIDITKKDDLIKKIIKISPDIIILTAAMTDVDKNESNKALATKINFIGPQNVVEACKRVNSKLIFMSTDFIFDGVSKEGNYKEEDLPNPLNHYGKTKLEAEKFILSSDIEYLVCRTAVLYGWNEKKLNFITWILDKLKKKETLSIVTDQTNSPTNVNNLAEMILNLINKEERGIVHTAGEGWLNRYEMAITCAEVFNYNKELIVPVEHFEQKAKRPKNVGLNIDKVKKIVKSEMKIFNFYEGLEYMKENKIIKGKD